MNLTPLVRACLATKLPRGLFTDQGGLYLKDSQIRANLRGQHVAVEDLVLAVSDTLSDLAQIKDCDADDVWPIAIHALAKRDYLAPSCLGMIVTLAMMPTEGAIDPDEWAIVVRSAPQLSTQTP